MQEIKAVMKHDKEVFETSVNILLKGGYKLFSADCRNFNPAGEPDMCWTAILIKDECQAIAPQITLNVEDVKGRIDADFVISEISSTLKEATDGKSAAVTA